MNAFNLDTLPVTVRVGMGMGRGNTSNSLEDREVTVVNKVREEV